MAALTNSFLDNTDLPPNENDLKRISFELEFVFLKKTVAPLDI